MTQLLAANTGAFPRIGENKDEQRHRRGMAHWLKKEISNHAFQDVQQSVIQEVIREQIDAGLDEITDGLIGWLDPISFFCQNLSNVTLTSYTRYLDRNFYYRLPVLSARPKRSKPTYLPFYQFASGHSAAPVRTVITGPVALARHTVSQTTALKKLPARVDIFTELLAEEIAVLVKEGAKIIQIDEPALGAYPEDLAFLKKALTTLVRNKPSARFILSVGGGPLAGLYEKLAQLPVDVLNLDLTHNGQQLVEKITASPAPLSIGFGLVNAGFLRDEDTAPLSALIRDWIKKTGPSMVYLTPSSHLDQLPRAAAVEKLKRLVQLKQELTA